MKKTAFLGLIAFMLVLGFVSCGDELPDELAGTVWNGRHETTSEFSYDIIDGKFTWEGRRHPFDFENTSGDFDGESLVGTTWEGRWIDPDTGELDGPNHKLEFIDETTAEASWEQNATVIYTLEGNTINFAFTIVREHTLVFEENSNFRNSNSSAVGTYTIRGSNLTLTGEWVGSDNAGQIINYTGTISGNTITLDSGNFYSVRVFYKEE